MTTEQLRTPFPYFGGKSKIMPLVWPRFGRVQNFVSPFFGGGSDLLLRPVECGARPALDWPDCFGTETVNDIDALLCNFWRATAADPEAVAHAADWPVNEVDLHARHRYLRDRRGWVEELMSDPDAYDAQLAGWWVWGISQWIGSGWCPPAGISDVRKLPHVGDAGMGVHRGAARPCGEEKAPGRGHGTGQMGVHADRLALPRKRPAIGGTGTRTHTGLGVHRIGLHAQPQGLARQMPDVGASGSGATGRGINTERVLTYGQIPELRGDSGATGRGIHASAFERKTGGLYAYFEALHQRLRRVRVCCGDWRRVLGPSVTFRHGLTAVFLDPPYDQDSRADVYAYESPIFHDVRQWAIENGDNPLMRIALCGYDFEMPEGWRPLAWKAHGGYGSQGEGQGRANAHREVVWFSPHCIDPAADARESFSKPIVVRDSDYTGTLFEELP